MERRRAPKATKAFEAMSFIVLPGFGILTPVLVLPAVSGNFGSDGFAAIALGQSVGLAFAVPVEMGWALTGPSLVARRDTIGRTEIISSSVLGRLSVWLLLCVPMLLVCLALGGSYRLETGLSAVSFALSGLSLSWVFIGLRRPLGILLSDALPRLFVAGLSAWLLNEGAPLWVYPVGQFLVSILGIVIALRMARVSLRKLCSIGWQRIAVDIRTQVPVMVGRGFSSVYVTVPIVLIAASTPSLTAYFAAIERMLRLSTGLLAALPNAFVGWTAGVDNFDLFQKRSRQSIFVNVVVGLISALLFAILAPRIAVYLFSDTVRVSSDVAILAGCVLLLTCCSRATSSLRLVPGGNVRIVTVSAVFGSAIGLPSIVVGAHLAGVRGAYWGMLLAEMIVLLIQIGGCLSSKVNSITRWRTVHAI